MSGTFLPSEQVEIDAVRDACTEHELNSWFDQSPVKARFKKACMLAQGLRCCYCHKYSNTTNNNEWDLEHILSEDGYSQFFVMEGNLAIACKRCNAAKGNQDVLVSTHPRPPNSLPGDSVSYSIPHPRIDNWAACLSHVNYQIYKSLNDKGTELMRVCKLNELAVQKAGLSYESVVAAVKKNFFDTMGGNIPSNFRDEVAIEHMARLIDGSANLQRDMLLVPLRAKLKSMSDKAAKRTAARAVNDAKQLVIKKTTTKLVNKLLLSAVSELSVETVLMPPQEPTPTLLIESGNQIGKLEDDERG